MISLKSRERKRGGSFTQLHIDRWKSLSSTLSRKKKQFEPAKYGQGNVNMGAGFGETCVLREGVVVVDGGHIEQIATCNLNLKATSTATTKRWQIK